MKKGKLVTIVGIDCSGKTTQINRLRKYYQSKNLSVKTVALEHKPMVWNIQRLSVEKCGKPLDFQDGLNGNYHGMAYNCDFFNHYCLNIKPLLTDSYDLIISDRYAICYKAYCFAVGVSSRFVNEFLDELVVEPDLRLLLDLDIKDVLERIHLRPSPRSIDETDAILKKLIDFYKREYRKNKRIIRIDASQPISVVTNELIFHIDKCRSKRH